MRLPVLLLFLAGSLISLSLAVEPVDPKCQCNASSIWVDVVFLIDCSSQSGPDGIDWYVTKIKSDLTQPIFSLYTDTGAPLKSIRASIIQYDSQANVAAPLGTIDNNGINNIILTYTGSSISNIQSGLKEAINQFDTLGRRDNAQQIIVLMTKTLQSQFAGYASLYSSSFRQNGGIIIVYEYLQSGSPDSSLVNLATQGYHGTSLDDTNNDFLTKAFCDANCFCPLDTHPFQHDSSRQIPSGGCYHVFETASNYHKAQYECMRFGGELPNIQSWEKQAFLARLILDEHVYPQSFWVGLQYNIVAAKFQWTDGSFLYLNSTDYQPWGYGMPDIDNNKYCVQTRQANEAVQAWTTADCRYSNSYACEVAPCDSNTYCL